MKRLHLGELGRTPELAQNKLNESKSIGTFSESSCLVSGMLKPMKSYQRKFK